MSRIHRRVQVCSHEREVNSLQTVGKFFLAEKPLYMLTRSPPEPEAQLRIFDETGEGASERSRIPWWYKHPCFSVDNDVKYSIRICCDRREFHGHRFNEDRSE